ncbi:MAG TPA: hypothetical protein VMB48_06680 [Steroidobacteraceae bacterium]|nr:hypothetical protein [Steroidobacteraceae bacterium]
MHAGQRVGGVRAFRRVLAASTAIAAFHGALTAAHAGDYTATTAAATAAAATTTATATATASSMDQDTLERVLFLCQWRSTDGVPLDAPTPTACTSAPISIDGALLQTKQWWTYWARFSIDEAEQGRIRFNDAFLAFQRRQRLQPELAAQLLPPAALPADDWRVRLVRELEAGARAADAATGRTAGPPLHRD